MNKREFERRRHLTATLRDLGFTEQEADQLRRIANTLQRWYELECGTGEGQTTRSIERETDDENSRPFMRVQYPTAAGYVDRRYPVPDRENGAKKRLAAILAARNARFTSYAEDTTYIWDNGTLRVRTAADPAPVPPVLLQSYIQTDPRGAPLYILRPGDVPAGEDASAYYSHGICVY